MWSRSDRVLHSPFPPEQNVLATNRTPINRARRRKITPEAVEAYRAGDYMRLHKALGLMP